MSTFIQKSITYDFGEAKSESDKRIGEGHDCGDDREPYHVVEIGNLRHHELKNSEQEHVNGIVVRTRRIMPFLVITVGSLYRSAPKLNNTNKSIIIKTTNT